MSDCDLILNELRQGSITAEQVWRRYGIQRCGARILDLRQRGFDIITVMKQVETRRGATSRIAEYFLKREAV